jgi:anti-sigma-K factor RskA
MSTHPQIPDDVAALISAHAMGALDRDQTELAERHIAESDDCRRAYEDALETAAALALAVADSEPSADLRDRILAAARAEPVQVATPSASPARKPAAPRRKRRFAGLLTPSSGFAALGIAAAVVFALIASSQHDSATSANDRQAALVAILSAKNARVVPLAETGGGVAQGNLIVASGRAALVSQLKHPPAGRTYQAWGLKPGAAPVPLPTFSRDGAVVLLDSVASYAQVGITVEPSGGSKAPSAAPFAIATL